MSEFVKIHGKQGYVMAHYTQIRLVKINDKITAYFGDDFSMDIDQECEDDLIKYIEEFRAK